MSSQEKTSKYHTSGLEREQIRQNYEDLRDILATIKRIYNETKDLSTEQGKLLRGIDNCFGAARSVLQIRERFFYVE